MGSDPTGTAAQAVRRAMEHIREGYEWVIDIDLRKFFDTVNHGFPSSTPIQKDKDGRVISLIHKNSFERRLARKGKLGKRIDSAVHKGVLYLPCVRT